MIYSPQKILEEKEKALAGQQADHSAHQQVMEETVRELSKALKVAEERAKSLDNLGANHRQEYVDLMIISHSV